MLGSSMGLTPFVFVSTIYNENGILSRGFGQKVQENFNRAFEEIISMTERFENPAPIVFGKNICTPAAYKMYKKPDFFRGNIVKESAGLPLTKGRKLEYSITNLIP